MVGGFHAERFAPERLDPLAVQVLQVFHIGHVQRDWPAHIGGDARIVPQEHAVFPAIRRVFSGGFFRLREIRIGCRAGGRMVGASEKRRVSRVCGCTSRRQRRILGRLPGTHARIARVTLCPPKPREFESPSLLGVPSSALNNYIFVYLAKKALSYTICYSQMNNNPF